MGSVIGLKQLAYRALLFSLSLGLVTAVSDVTRVRAAEQVLAIAQVRPVAAPTVFAPQDFLGYTNAVRAAYDQAPLTLNDQLNAAALAKAEDMAAKGYWDHFRPGDGKAPWAFIEENGYHYKVAGENLAKGFKTPAGITTAWMQSPAHLANLVSSKYNEVGFASVDSISSDGQHVLLTVQMFGSR